MYLIKQSFRELFSNDPLRLAGATAFFTTFALPAILLIILQLVRLALPWKQGKEELFTKLTKYVGRDSASHLINVLKGFESVADNWISAITGFIFLLFVATTLFKVIKNSINQIWNIKVVAKKTFTLALKMRLKELIIICSAGILFLFTIFLDGMQAFASEEFISRSRVAAFIFSNTTGFIISVIIATIWFGLIFSFLPDGRLPIGVSFFGAFITSILFNIGKLVLKSALHNGNLNTIFGNSAAVVLLLLFVFYSALIFYLGAAFVKVLAERRGVSIQPLPHAKKDKNVSISPSRV